MIGRPNIRSFLAVMAGSLVAMAIAVTCLPHTPYTRYQSFQDTIFYRLDWVYERLAFDETPIDILLVGSSRTARGVDAAALEMALAERGLNLHVANISIPAAGFDSRLTTIRETLRHQDIKLLVWGLAEAFPRDGHQVFADLARPTELLGSPWLVNRNLPANIARLPYRQIEYWVASHLPEAFGYQSQFDPKTYEGPTPDLRLFNDPDWSLSAELEEIHTDEHAQKLESDAVKRRAGIRPPILPEGLSWIEFGLSQHYIKELEELSERDGFELSFLFLPFYRGYDVPIEADWLSKMGPVWSADFLHNDPVNYVDTDHVSQVGADQVIPWLADHIASQLME